MATFTTTINSFELKSSWTFQYSNGQGYYYGPTTPTTASKTVTVDLSSIIHGSRLISARLSISTTRNGTSYAECNGQRVNVTGEHTSQSSLLDVTSWFTTLGGSIAIKFEYQSHTPSSGSTSKTGFNKCTFADMTLTVNYELPNSTGTFDVSTVEAGPNASIGLTISPANADYTHTAVWTFGAQTVTQNLAAGVTTTSLAIPMSFCSEIPNATSGTGTVVLTTYNNGTQLGDPQTYTFTVTVPATVVPTAGSLESTPVTPSQSLANLYVQRYSHAALTLASVQGAYGSTITSVVFSGWGGSTNGTKSGDNYTGNSATLNTSGSVTLRAVVTDSRGRTCTKERTITVSAYSAPTIESISANRCTQDGTRSDTGTYALLTVNYNITSLGGNNTATTATAYKTTDAADYTNANTTFGDNVATMLTVGGVFAADKSYNIRATVSDSLTNTATAQITLQTAEYVLHFLNGGKSIGIGRAALNTPQTVAINPTWSLILGKHGDATQTIDVAEEISWLGADVSNLETTVNAMATDAVSATRITGTLPVDHGGTGGTTVAEAKAALGFTQKEVVTASNNSAVAENSTMFSVEINLAEGDMWQGIAVLGVNSSTNTDFLVFFDDDYTVANYRSYLRYGTSSVVENGCMMAFTGIATRKCVARFTVSMLGGMAIVTGQCIRGDGKIGDFVIAKAVSGVTNLVIRPSAAVTAGHGSSIMLTKVY